MNINFKSAEICSVLQWDKLTKWQVSCLPLPYSKASSLIFLSSHSMFSTLRRRPLNWDLKKKPQQIKSTIMEKLPAT